MAVIINGDTGIDKITDGSVVAADIGDGEITQAKLASGVAGTGPAFRVKQSSGQALSQSTWTKLTLNSEDFDTASMFDATTNYRFQPTVEGYYQISGTVGMAVGGSRLIVAIYKNGSNDFVLGDGTMNNISGSGLIYFNGSTDYVELYARTDRSGGDTTQQVRFTGHLARGA